MSWTMDQAATALLAAEDSRAGREPLTVEWPEGYSGCAGVPAGKKSSQGVHAGSGSVLGLLSVSPARIAVIGRQ